MAQLHQLLEAKQQRQRKPPAWAATESGAHAGGTSFQSHPAPESVTDTPPMAARHIKQP